jgi:hypothetical protein
MRTIQEIEQQAQKFHVRRHIDDTERNRQAVLMAKPSPGDQRLFTPTKCRVLRTFCVQGQPVEIGSTVTLAKHDADSLAALGKVELL